MDKAGRRPPRQLTAASLETAALAYLERFASSSANLRRILLRKVARAAAADAADAVDVDAATRLIDALIARYLAAGLLDDRTYATQSAASLRRRGGSRQAIGARLAQKGVEREVIDTTFAAEDGTGDLAAACALLRRRRLGAYRTTATDATQRRRDLAALARAGFSLDVARRVLAAPDRETLERLARGDGEA